MKLANSHSRKYTTIAKNKAKYTQRKSENDFVNLFFVVLINAQLLFVTIQYVDFYGVTNEHEL